jgi:hypothetical protein
MSNQPRPVSICLVPTSGMVPAILSFHLALTRAHHSSRLILVYNMDSVLVQGEYALSDHFIQIEHVRFIEDAYDIAFRLNFQCNLMLWDNNQCIALNPLTTLGAAFCPMIQSFTNSAIFVFFPDGWVGMSHPSAAQKNFIDTNRIDIVNCIQMQLVESKFLINEFRSFGLRTIVVDITSVRESLLICHLFCDSLTVTNTADSHSSFISPSTKVLFVVMRAWHSREFHGGLYSFGTEDPIKSVIHVIDSSLRYADMTFMDFDRVVICPDTRTNHIYSDVDLKQQLSIFGSVKVQFFSDYAGMLIPQGLTLDYMLPGILELHESTVYSFDSNTPVPFYLANYGFQSIIGAPADTLLAQQASSRQINYIKGNIERLKSYCCRDRYSIRHDNTVAVVTPTKGH